MRFSLPLYLLFLGVILFSCNKPVLNENGTLPANSLGVVFTDTLTVRSYTYTEDTLRGDNQSVSILGSMDDATFGKSYAGVYAQFALPVNNLNLGTNLRPDSVILSLKYLGYYGKLSVPMNIKVYRMTERIYVDSTYNTARTFAAPTLVGSLTNYVPNMIDSVYNHYKADTLGHPPLMKISLDKGVTLGEDLLAQSGSSNVVDNNAWLNYFGGLYITVDTGNAGGSIVYLDMRSTETQMKIYYKGDNSVDTVISFYSTPSSAQIVNHYKHNYANSSVGSVLGSTNPDGDSLTFAQAMAGVKCKLFVPYIKNINNGKIAINKAELMLTAVSDNSNYADPLQITANGVTSAGTDTILFDQRIGASYFGGFQLVESVQGISKTRYRIDLAHYYQGVVQGNTDSGIFIYPTPSQRIADRVAFGGGTHSRYKVKLNLTYTLIH